MTSILDISVSEVASTEPVSLQDIKDWIGGLEGVSDFDAMLSTMGKSARQRIEKYINLSLIPWTVTMAFDVQKCDGWEDVFLPYAKGVTGVNLSSLDSSDTQTTLASGTDYFIRGATVRLTGGRYQVSYTTVPGVVPEDLKEAIKMEVANRFKNRGESVNGVKGITLSDPALEKAQPYRAIWL